MTGNAEGKSGGNDRQAEVLGQLAVPFNPELINWKVTATNKGRNNTKQGLLVPYADPRAYTDRLNAVVTAAGWTREYEVHVVDGFSRSQRESTQAVESAKVLVVCRVTIDGVGSHSGTGEAWADDENAMTSAEAQAFKRACVCFGLGRYLYDVPSVWVDLDERDRLTQRPHLPPWAVPGKKAGRSPGTSGEASSGSGSSKASEAGSNASSSGSSSGQAPKPRRASGHTANGKETPSDLPRGVVPQSPKGGGTEAAAKAPGNGGHENLRQEIAALEVSTGAKMYAAVLKAVCSTEKLEDVTDLALLLTVRERLSNVSRGMTRLKQAVNVGGLTAYAAVCKELRFSGGPQDIADTKLLRTLVERMEQIASQKATQPTARIQ
jgi:hypothetical protein